MAPRFEENAGQLSGMVPSVRSLISIRVDLPGQANMAVGHPTEGPEQPLVSTRGQDNTCQQSSKGLDSLSSVEDRAKAYIKKKMNRCQL